jgi:hypothetical protein
VRLKGGQKWYPSIGLPINYPTLCSRFLFCMGISNNQCLADIFGMRKIMIKKLSLLFMWNSNE